MGLNIVILVQPCTPEQRAEFRASVAMDEHMPGRFDHEQVMEVHLFDRFWAPGVGSGHWPTIQELLRSFVSTFPAGSVRYCSDADNPLSGDVVSAQMIRSFRKAWFARNKVR